jgi:hypothetical protein
MVNLSKARLLFFCPDPMISQEIDRWTNQEWAVKIETREIFHIEDMEVFGNELVVTLFQAIGVYVIALIKTQPLVFAIGFVLMYGLSKQRA